MHITTDDARRYDGFIFEAGKALGCFLEPPIPDDFLVWHYTNGAGLLGIVKSGTLFSTQVSCLNDTREFRYAADLFRAALQKVAQSRQSENEKKIAEAASKYYSIVDEAYPGSVPYFVTCFTELRDSTNQWMNYGHSREPGYAIGFSPHALMLMGNGLIKVSYDQAKHEEVALKLANGTVDFYCEGIRVKKTVSPDDWTNEFLPDWEQRITQLAPLIKDPGWAHEKEYRIVALLMKEEVPQLQMLQKSTMMTRHLPLKVKGISGPPALPIRRVIVGPCPHPAISRISVDTLLRQHGYPGGLVDVSTSPVRPWSY